METALQRAETREMAPMTAKDVMAQVKLVQEVLHGVMQDGEHYGKIPGTGKPTLLKPGAEKLCMTFRMSPDFTITKTDMPNGHREYEIVCRLSTITSGMFLGAGVGCCSTMESKYRYRNVADFELTGEPIPKDSKERKAEYRRQGFGMKKVDGVWEWVKYTDAERSENPDIADVYNTVLKMAKKRALVDAVLTATAASDLFTQDMEEMSDRMGQHEEREAPAAPAAPAAAPRQESRPATPPPSGGAAAPKSNSSLSYYNYDEKNLFVVFKLLHKGIQPIMTNPWPKSPKYGIEWSDQKQQPDASLISVWSFCHDRIVELRNDPSADTSRLDEAIGVLMAVSSELVSRGHHPHATFEDDDIPY